MIALLPPERLYRFFVKLHIIHPPAIAVPPMPWGDYRGVLLCASSYRIGIKIKAILDKILAKIALYFNRKIVIYITS